MKPLLFFHGILFLVILAFPIHGSFAQALFIPIDFPPELFSPVEIAKLSSMISAPGDDGPIPSPTPTQPTPDLLPISIRRSDSFSALPGSSGCLYPICIFPPATDLPCSDSPPCHPLRSGFSHGIPSNYNGLLFLYKQIFCCWMFNRFPTPLLRSFVL